MILQMRVDERLLHGQVCCTWISTLGATHVIVANDGVANDSMQKSIMSLGIPGGVKSIFSTLDKAVGILNNPKSEPLKIFVVVQSPKDALYMVERVPKLQEVNVANYGLLKKNQGPVEFKIGIWLELDAENVEVVKKIKSIAKDVYFQDIAGATKQKLNL